MEDKENICSYCGQSAKEPLLRIRRADIEAFVKVCPDCAKEIDKVNQQYTKATAIGCAFIGVILALFVILTFIIYVCSN